MPPLTLVRVVTAWRFDPLALVLAVSVGASYAWAMRRVSGWPRTRSLPFYAVGLGGLLLVSVSFIGVYANTLFWVRAVQVIVLFMIVPFGLALGAPATLARKAFSEDVQQRLDRALASLPVRLATHPAAGSVLMLTTLWLLYFTGWYPAMLRSGWLDVLTRLALLAIGFVYFYGRLQLDPAPRRYPHGIALIISVVEGLVDAVLGLVLWLGPALVASAYYAGLHRGWGPSLRTDQIIGAGILWIGGDLADLPFLGALLHRMNSRDTEEAAEIDRKLDETEKALAISGHESVTPDEPVMLRPWWQDDPELSERLRRDQ
ncbi:MAG: cytochrome c oxidase assembly protein [Sciscionella sp.]